MKKIPTQPDTIAEGIANLEHHERDPGEQMPPIINDDNTPAEIRRAMEAVA